MLTLDADTARRFILGRQGLWPGRRWRGLEGTAQAMHAMEYLQLDPLQIIARSQDIALCSRVLDYAPEMWEAPTYERRDFFDWGGWLAVRPMSELPHWRVAMRRERDGHPRLLQTASEHREAIDEMRAVLAERGVVSNRDFSMKARRRTNDYRGRKDSSVALYYLWRTGEAMTHHRERFERVYALTEHVAPRGLIYESDEIEADRFFLKKEIRFCGLARFGKTSDAHLRGAPYGKAELLEQMLADGEVVEVRVEGWRGTHYALAEDMPLIEEVAAGRVPTAWAPLEATTAEEAVFLAPLDPVSARGRAKVVFGFDYVWEVYKPESQRKYGYYALPVLWGDRLVARFDSRLDRATNTWVILGFWLEHAALGADESFAEALSRGFVRFARFLGAGKLDVRAIGEPLLRKRAKAAEKALR